MVEKNFEERRKSVVCTCLSRLRRLLLGKPASLRHQFCQAHRCLRSKLRECRVFGSKLSAPTGWLPDVIRGVGDILQELGKKLRPLGSHSWAEVVEHAANKHEGEEAVLFTYRWRKE